MAAAPISHLLARYETVEFSLNAPDLRINFYVTSEVPTTRFRDLNTGGRHALFVHISPASRAELEGAVRAARGPWSAFPRSGRGRPGLLFGSDTLVDEKGNVVEKREVSENERVRGGVWIIHWSIAEVVCLTLAHIPDITTDGRVAIRTLLLNELGQLFSCTTGVHAGGQRLKTTFTAELPSHVVDPSSGIRTVGNRADHYGCCILSACVWLNRRRPRNSRDRLDRSQVNTSEETLIFDADALSSGKGFDQSAAVEGDMKEVAPAERTDH